MRIAGVAGDKHPTLRKGDAIELTVEKKLLAMATEVLVQYSAKGFTNIPISSKVIGDVKVLEGRKDIKNPEPNQYIGTVEIVYKVLNLQKDKLFQEKKAKIKVQFQDSKDELGMPDLECMTKEVTL